MKLTFYKSESAIKPELVDSNSSKKYVYIRQNIVEIQRTDDSGENYTYYEYEECKLTKEEYEQYLSEMESTETLQTVENLKAENQMLTEQVDMLDETMAIMLEEILPSLIGE